MSVRRQWVSMPVLWLCACGSAETPLPFLSSAEPASMPADSRFLLTLNLDGQFPVQVDYGGDSGRVMVTPPVKASVGDRDFELSRIDDHGRRLTLDIIPWLPMGLQDLRVQFEDGRQVVLEQGFEVKPPLNLTGFTIDPIGPQVRGQPFAVTMRAQGPDAALFQGRVIVRSTQGNVNPKVSDAFQVGVLQQEFTAQDSAESTLSLIVEDYAGHTGSSNEFFLAKP
ncbi:MAG: hypothetical protein ACJ8AT_35240 [Hyalangium sp.]|uniref:hypothetical protein n=1 Tax=Hyalangium sp. TaxID=2028555 RepID=UPI003899BC57